MEIYDNLLEYSEESLIDEFIFENTSIEELLYLKRIIEKLINNKIDKLLEEIISDKDTIEK